MSSFDPQNSTVAEIWNYAQGFTLALVMTIAAVVGISDVWYPVIGGGIPLAFAIAWRLAGRPGDSE